MATIIENHSIAPGVSIMRARPHERKDIPAPGQFYMLRTWQKDPLLSRPISVFDYDYNKNILTYLYQVVGRGTEALFRAAPSSEIELNGPYGNGFSDVEGDLLLVGGGIGIAPLYYQAKMIKWLHPDKKVRALLGFPRKPYAVDYFDYMCDSVSVKVGGYVTDNLEVFPNETVICCGPLPMMQKVSELVPADNPVYLSLEARMACGLGACLGCVTEAPLVYRKTQEGNKLAFLQNKHVKICTEGPVFKRVVV